MLDNAWTAVLPLKVVRLLYALDIFMISKVLFKVHIHLFWVSFESLTY